MNDNTSESISNDTNIIIGSNINNKWYYMNESGIMAKGRVKFLINSKAFET